MDNSLNQDIRDAVCAIKLKNFEAAIEYGKAILNKGKQMGDHDVLCRGHRILGMAIMELAIRPLVSSFTLSEDNDIECEGCVAESYLNLALEHFEYVTRFIDSQLSALEFTDYFDDYSSNEFQLPDPKMFERNESNELSMKSDKSGLMRGLLRRLSSVFLPNRDLRSERETNSEN
ncbi:hypothetical protein DdX_05109 [Ditylenchus destructor]|uniref:Uncharacterized protein n=1 Tax=Ditylenchus destructor TaxID=166010 RepID=A0AAD4NC57_9BILA|nr:hypothetical protein DdX_05109 [Ditylenchus destructor]